MKNQLKRIDPTVQDVKRAINSMVIPHKGIRVPVYPGEVSDIVTEIWFSIKKNHTRKQTVRIINQMTLDEIEMFLAMWKLERSVDE